MKVLKDPDRVLRVMDAKLDELSRESQGIPRADRKRSRGDLRAGDRDHPHRGVHSLRDQGPWLLRRGSHGAGLRLR